MRRTLQTVAIPVFQFGMFSETDLAFHAGAEAFSFGGRVHTNGNLFLAAANGGSLTIADRITAVEGRHPDAPAERAADHDGL